ncbi:MAG: hypothetical protein WBE75_05200 [Candidatus Omnitrophota bacterium]
MENSKSRFSIKRKPLIIIGCFLAVFFLIIPNFLLSVNKQRISDGLNSRSLLPVSFKAVYYLPPNLLIFKDTAIRAKTASTADEMIFIPETYIVFSLPRLFKKRYFKVSSLRCFRPRIDYGRVYLLVKENYRLILDFIWSAPRQDITLSIKEGGLLRKKENGSYSVLRADSTFTMKGNSFALSGRVGRNTFELNGSAENNRINVEKFKFANRALDGEIWGKVSAETAELKGFLFINNTGIIDRNTPENIFILDIDSLVKFDCPRIEIDRLNFSINNNPVKIKAALSLERPYACDLKIDLAFRGFKNMGKDSLKNISLSASLILREDNSLLVNGSAGIDFPEWRKEPFPLQNARLRFKDLAIPTAKTPFLDINAVKLDLFCLTSANPYTIRLDDLRARIRPAGKNARIVAFSSGFHGGTLKGTARVGLKDYTPVIAAFAVIENAEADELDEILIHFSKVYGKLSSSMTFINYPQMIFKGDMHIRDGYLDNFSFFKWLADLFALPALNKVAFRTADINFLVDKDGAGLNNMRLDSDNVKLSGYFNLAQADMVSSKIALSFPRALLKGSPKFTPLLNLLNKKISVLNFNFQLSGELNDMNFQWLQSDFKDELQKAIPDFAEAGFEEKVEGIIESISHK